MFPLWHCGSLLFLLVHVLSLKKTLWFAVQVVNEYHKGASVSVSIGYKCNDKLTVK